MSRVIVVSPSDTGIRQARAKTDRLDARTLAKMLWAGELDGVWAPDERVRAMRRRLARHAQLVRARSRVRNQIPAVLMRCLADRAPAADLLGVTGRRWLAEQQLAVCEHETTWLASPGWTPAPRCSSTKAPEWVGRRNSLRIN